MENYKNPALSPEVRAGDLLSRMTLREKIGQLTQRLYGFGIYRREGDEIRFDDEFRAEVERYSGIGTIYGLHRADPWSARDFETGLSGILAVNARNQLQKYVIEHSRLGIPALLSTECPHGHQALDGYLLPVNLAAGCSFSPDLLEETAKVSGQQLKAMGVDLALVSCLDILRDPRWGRSEECFGEDPFLASQMAGAVVRGIQSEGVEVTAKHLCAQGETTGGINASAARIGQRELREIHLPPVKACVEAGVTSFMAAYNEIDGIYCHANRALLTDLLRGEYGFEGFVMSDGVAIDQLDAVTGDRCASGALALNAGVDMGLWDTAFSMLEEALDRGLVEEARIDEAVMRILTVKFRRGLFEDPYLPEHDDYCKYNYVNFSQVKDLAEQSLVLLKNDGILPLSADKPMKLGLFGPNADAIYHQLGDYTPPIRHGAGITPLRGLRELLKDSPVELVTAPGFGLFDAFPDIAGAMELAKDCDAIILCLGGSSSRFAAAGEFDSNGAMKNQTAVTMDCGENVDDHLLRLPGRQVELLWAMRALGKPVITVLIGGRPYEMGELDSDAIIQAFYPGLTGGEAIAKLIFGQIEPAGRLSVTLPDHVGQLPVAYNAKDSYRYSAYYRGEAPRYRFGDGLTYTDFGYELISADCNAVTVRITNTGSRPGWAVPQLYLHRTQGVVTSRVSLWAFDKRLLSPGESWEITLPIPAEALMQWDWSMVQRRIPGRIEWFVKDCGQTHLFGEFLA